MYRNAVIFVTWHSEKVANLCPTFLSKKGYEAVQVTITAQLSPLASSSVRTADPAATPVMVSVLLEYAPVATFLLVDVTLTAPTALLMVTVVVAALTTDAVVDAALISVE